MEKIDQIKIVKKLVEDSFDENAIYTGIDDMNEENKTHIIKIGTSILCTKWEIGYEGGGFVQAVVNNDLMKAVGSADGTSLKGLKFFASLLYNTPRPMIHSND
jgi:hypothetical protein|tara:strand:+ start:187 stop:495 length:309 start_codon:yes stop_codon:yes gene_type:complete